MMKIYFVINPYHGKKMKFLFQTIQFGKYGFSGWIGQTILGEPSVFPIEENLVGAKCNGSLEAELSPTTIL